VAACRKTFTFVSLKQKINHMKKQFKWGDDEGEEFAGTDQQF